MNVRSRQVLYLLLVSALLPACDGRSTTRSSTDGVQGPLRRSTALCPGADTLRYSNLLANDETGDLSGFMITLVSANGRWTGYSQEAAGELGGPVSLVALRVDTGANGVSFGMPSGPDTSRFLGSLSCDSLWGNFRTYATTEAEPLMFRRVR